MYTNTEIKGKPCSLAVPREQLHEVGNAVCSISVLKSPGWLKDIHTYTQIHLIWWSYSFDAGYLATNGWILVRICKSTAKLEPTVIHSCKKPFTIQQKRLVTLDLTHRPAAFPQPWCHLQMSWKTVYLSDATRASAVTLLRYHTPLMANRCGDWGDVNQKLLFCPGTRGSRQSSPQQARDPDK